MVPDGKVSHRTMGRGDYPLLCHSHSISERKSSQGRPELCSSSPSSASASYGLPFSGPRPPFLESQKASGRWIGHPVSLGARQRRGKGPRPGLVMPAAEVPALRSWQLAAGEGGHTSQVLSASQPCFLTEGGVGGQAGGRGSSRPKTGLTSLRNQVWETHMHRDVHKRCRKDSSGPHMSLCQRVCQTAEPEATSHSNQTPVTEKALDCDLSFSSQCGAPAPGGFAQHLPAGPGPPLLLLTPPVPLALGPVPLGGLLRGARPCWAPALPDLYFLGSRGPAPLCGSE